MLSLIRVLYDIWMASIVLRFVVFLIPSFDLGHLIGHIACARWAGLWTIPVVLFPSVAEYVHILPEYLFFCLQGSLGTP